MTLRFSIGDETAEIANKLTLVCKQRNNRAPVAGFVGPKRRLSHLVYRIGPVCSRGPLRVDPSQTRPMDVEVEVRHGEGCRTIRMSSVDGSENKSNLYSACCW